MKFCELPDKWKKKAIELEINFLNQSSEEMAKENGSDPVLYSEEDIEVHELLNTTGYVIEHDEVTKEAYLSRQTNL